MIAYPLVFLGLKSFLGERWELARGWGMGTAGLGQNFTI